MDNQPRMGDVLRKRLLHVINPDPEPPKVKRPSNAALWLGYIFFNLVFMFLDIISAVTVAGVTAWFYGVLTFLAGFVPMVLHEFLYIRAYASRTQRRIAVIGGVLGVSSTIVIGIMAGVLNALIFLKMVSTSGQLEFWIEVGMILTMILISAMHGVAVATYFYIDPGILAGHKHGSAIAEHQVRLQALALASEIVESAQAVSAQIEASEQAGKLDLLEAAFTKVTGAALLPSAQGGRRRRRGRRGRLALPDDDVQRALLGGGPEFEPDPRFNGLPTKK